MIDLLLFVYSRRDTKDRPTARRPGRHWRVGNGAW